ncbi:amidohydrolase family protein [Bailinhaonella thermotolerans]|uniref:Amidohydrolase n=1 Tax=Bailinhaonella thermotolerans TaxID=1070861 RepID=A0A3A4AHA9_9ACTN|nr:amidohydrolase family protein [Bailinhaonella thermotolerans]RJL25083.1 amidohydrolase [Bailinhaonella thermotolerans]
MSRVDAHHHLWDTGAREYPWMDGPWADPLRGVFDEARYTAEARPHGVDAAVVVQALADVAETRELLELTTRSELVRAVVGWVPLDAPGVVDVLAELMGGAGGKNLAGVRHLVQDEPDPAWLERPETRRGLAAVAEAGLAYDLLVKPPQYEAALRTARDLPGVQFVLDHLGKPGIAAGMWEPWAAWIADLAALPNVTAKVSGLVTEADWNTPDPARVTPYVRHALDVFGPERLMFGSDWPVCTLAVPYGGAVETTDLALAGLSDAERESVLSGTARRVYRL